MNIGITLTSSLHVGQEYIDLTESIAKGFAREGFGIVYGGTDYGMMGKLALAYKESGGSNLIGVMARDLAAVTQGYKACEKLDESLWEERLSDRTRKIIELSDGFCILPGGYGTMEEIGSIVGGKVNKLFDKPIVIYNYDGFYNTFVAFLNEIHGKQFSKVGIDTIALISNNLEEVIEYYRNYSSNFVPDKFI